MRPVINRFVLPAPPTPPDYPDPLTVRFANPSTLRTLFLNVNFYYPGTVPLMGPNAIVVTHGNPTAFTTSLQSYHAILRAVTMAKFYGATVVIRNQANLYWTRMLSDGGVVSRVYSQARLALIRSMGQFCSYCEQSVTDSALAVEHMLPKDKFLDVSCSYNNFLLACPMCNSFKGTRPVTGGYNVPLALANPPIANIAVAGAYDDVKSVLYNAYQWPMYRGSFRYFTSQIRCNVARLPLNSNPAAIAAWEAAAVGGGAPNRGDHITGIQDGQVGASIGGVLYPSVRLLVGGTPAIDAVANGTVPTGGPPYPTPLGPGDNHPSTTIRHHYDPATHQGLLNLNNVDLDLKLTDRRVLNRTKSLFAAIDAFNLLNDAEACVHPGSGNSAYSIMLEEICSTASATGFFSIWIKVFNVFAPATPGVAPPAGPGPTPAGGATPTMHIPNATVDLILDLTVNAPPGSGFPGTNINNNIP